MRREIDVQSPITHPNVKPVLDFEHDDWQWFTMSLAVKTLDKCDMRIESGSLEAIIRVLRNARDQQIRAVTREARDAELASK
jgi:hypothetical protein